MTLAHCIRGDFMIRYDTKEEFNVESIAE